MKPKLRDEIRNLVIVGVRARTFLFRFGRGKNGSKNSQWSGIAVEVLSLDTRLPSEVDSYFVVPIQAPERFTERSLDEAAQEVIEEL